MPTSRSSKEPIHGKRLVYLDSAASAQKPKAVLDKMDWAYEHAYANVHRGLHTLANRATEAYEGGRKAAARLLNASRPEEIVFTKGSTEAINLVASSFAAPRIKEGDEIVVSILEHHSNIVPWHFLRERQGAVLKFVDVPRRRQFRPRRLRGRRCRRRTKMVAVTHMSNVTGTVVPIAEVIARAHARGIPVLIDGSQGAVHLKVDVQALDVDFYVFTGHKLYGPTGIGVLYGKSEHLDAMRPYQGGGEMIDVVTLDTVTYNDPPHRFEAGTPPIVQAIGLGAAIDYVEGLGREAIAAHEQEVADLCARAAEADQFAAADRRRARQGRDLLVQAQGRARPRRCDHPRPLRHRRARRHALRHAAAEALRRDLYLPGLARPIFGQGRHRRAGRGHRKGTETSSHDRRSG